MSEVGDRQRVIDGFVARLVAIREDAGRPSFRSMAKRSGAISHATMHDAVQGTRLPSWETTVEFAKACGVDPETLRAHWDEADAVLHPDDRESGEPEASETVPEPVEDEARAEADAQGDETPRAPRRLGRTQVVLIAAAFLVGAGGAALVVRAMNDPGGAAQADTAPKAAATSPSAGNTVSYPPLAKDLVTTTIDPQGCPANVLHQRGQRPARAKGDGGRVKDLTIKDCSVQKRGAHLEKKFRLYNIGSVDWIGRRLVRIERDATDPACRMPTEVLVPTIKAGESGVVTIPITAPSKKAVCFARWMQLDEDNEWAFPDQRPYYLSFRVA